MTARFPSASKRPNVPGIIDLPKFSYEDLEELLQVHRVIWSLLVTQVVTYIRTTPLLLLFIANKFLVRTMIKFRITKEKEKGEDTIKRPQQNV